jgi:acyl-coenzyme A thioesterase PaaI-like protein
VPGPDGTLQIEAVTPALASPHSALHLGPINIALEAAATDELERVTGSNAFQVESWSIVMVKPGYHGPFLATATVIGRGERVGVEAVMTDAGAGGRTIATVSASFRRV